MHREPDWEALGQLQFLLMRRLIEPLNAGLAAVSLVHLDSAADKPREYWQQRATGEVMGVLNLVNAWHALIRYKLGELLPHQHIRPFDVQELLDWLSSQLELVNPLHVGEKLILESSREALQEALLLLYSAAYTLGPNVHLIVQSTGNGVWFRVRYGRRGDQACASSLDDLINRLSGNWRLEDSAFELRLANDFVALSGSQLHLQGTEHFCEMAFFVYAVGQRPPEPRRMPQVTQPPPMAASAEDEILISVSRRTAPDEETKPLSASEMRAIEAAIIRTDGDAIAGVDGDTAANISDDAVAEQPAGEVRPEGKAADRPDSRAAGQLLFPPPIPPVGKEAEPDEPARPRVVWSRALRDISINNPPSDDSPAKQPGSSEPDTGRR